MKSILVCALLFSSYSSAQLIEEEAYMNYIDSLVTNDLAEVHDYKSSSDNYTHLRGFYYDHELIAVETEQVGELANLTRCRYYLKNGLLFSSCMHDCRTNEYEILDLALYSEANRDSLGRVDYSKLPTNCMTLKLFCASGKMTREVEGIDVFDQPASISEKQRKDFETCDQLLSELERYSKI